MTVADAFGSFPIVLSAPSGAGKTSIARGLVQESGAFTFSVSATTRAARAGERDGWDYHFVDRPEFERMIAASELCEWAEVHGEYYGTPVANVVDAAAKGVHVVLDIDVQGARQIRERIPEAVLVFVLPPSGEVLLERLRGRGSEGSEALRTRLRTARTELEAAPDFDFVVVNDDLEVAIEEVREIARAEGRRPGRKPEFDQELDAIRSVLEGQLNA